jgi:hypothetical protein
MEQLLNVAACADGATEAMTLQAYKSKPTSLADLGILCQDLHLSSDPDKPKLDGTTLTFHVKILEGSPKVPAACSSTGSPRAVPWHCRVRLLRLLACADLPRSLVWRTSGIVAGATGYRGGCSLFLSALRAAVRLLSLSSLLLTLQAVNTPAEIHRRQNMRHSVTCAWLRFPSAPCHYGVI